MTIFRKTCLFCVLCVSFLSSCKKENPVAMSELMVGTYTGTQNFKIKYSQISGLNASDSIKEFSVIFMIAKDLNNDDNIIITELDQNNSISYKAEKVFSVSNSLVFGIPLQSVYLSGIEMQLSGLGSYNLSGVLYTGGYNILNNSVKYGYQGVMKFKNGSITVDIPFEVITNATKN